MIARNAINKCNSTKSKIERTFQEYSEKTLKLYEGNMKIWFLLKDAHKCSFLPKAPWNMNYSSKLLENAVSSSKQPKFLFSPTQSKIWFPPQNQTENMKSQSNLKMQFAPQSNLDIWFSLRWNIKPRPSLKYGNMKIWFSPECNL